MAETKNLPKPDEKVGGYLIGQENGKTVLHEDGKKGGIFVGRTHAEKGGIHAVNTDTNQPLLVENLEIQIVPQAVKSNDVHTLDGKSMSVKEVLSDLNEKAGGVKIAKRGAIVDKREDKPIRLPASSVIITRPAVLLEDTKKRNFDGEMLSNIEILSILNSNSGGVSFSKDNIPEIIKTTGKHYSYGGKLTPDYEIASDCGCQHSKMAEGGKVQSEITPEENKVIQKALSIFSKETGMSIFFSDFKLENHYEKTDYYVFKRSITDKEKKKIQEAQERLEGRASGTMGFDSDQVTLQLTVHKDYLWGSSKYSVSISFMDKFDGGTTTQNIMIYPYSNGGVKFEKGGELQKEIFSELFTKIWDGFNIDERKNILEEWGNYKGNYTDAKLGEYAALDFKDLPPYLHDTILDNFSKKRDIPDFDKDNIINAADRRRIKPLIGESFAFSDNDGEHTINIYSVTEDDMVVYTIDGKKRGMPLEEFCELYVNDKYINNEFEAGGKIDESDYTIVDSIDWEYPYPSNKKIIGLYLKYWNTQLQLLTLEEDDTYLFSMWVKPDFFNNDAFKIGKKYSRDAIRNEVYRLLKDADLNSIKKDGVKSTILKNMKYVDKPKEQVLSELTQSRSAVIPMKEEKKRGKLKLSDIPESVKAFMPMMQQRAIVGSDEHWDTIDRLKGIIESMPEIYGQEKVPAKDKIVYLHYFYGQSDWYIVEKGEVEEGIAYAYGYVILNGDTDMAEWGSIDINDLKSTNKIELDFHFKPTKFGEVMEDEKQMAGENEVEANMEREYEETAEKEFKEADKSMPANPKLKSVTILWAEGSYGDVFPKSFNSFKQMTKWIRDNIDLAPEGYDKHKIEWVWNDGEKSTDRLDVSKKENNPFVYNNIWALSQIESVIYSVMGEKVNPKEYDDYLSDLGKEGLELTAEEFNKIIKDTLEVYLGASHLNFKKDYKTYDNALKVLQERLPKTFAVFSGVPAAIGESGKSFGDKIIPAIRHITEDKSDESAKFDELINDNSYITAIYKGVQFTIQDNHYLKPPEKSYTIFKKDGTVLDTITDEDAGSMSKLAFIIVDHITLLVDSGYGKDKDSAVKFTYGKRFDVPAAYSSELLQSLKKLGFTIVEEHKQSVDIKKEGYGTIFVNDNGGELNLGEVGDKGSHISNVPYSINTGNRRPYSLAADINEDYNAHYNVVEEKTESKPAVEPEPITAKTVTASTLVVNANEKITSKKQYEINNAVKDLIKEKGSDRNKYSADELALLKLWSGSGSLAKQGAKGTGLLDQFFTPPDICSKMWGLALKYGFKFNGANILENACGVGRFFANIPKDVACNVVGYDIDETAVTICKVLYPEYDIRHASFETMFFTGRRHIGLAGVKQYFDLVISNPPYRPYVSEYSPLGEKEATGADTMEMYFIMRGVDVLKKGGLLIYIIPNTFLSNDTKYNDFKEKLAKKADLIDAYRLPNGVFPNTDVATDIIVLRRKGEEKKEEEPVKPAMDISAPAAVSKKKVQTYGGHVGANDDFGKPITDEFVDGVTVTGQWGIMNPDSFKKYGSGLGLGKGQRCESPLP